MASPEATRLLVLGVVVLFEPVNGYQVRRELLSWEVDDWAGVNPGSVYSMLATLTKQGAIERHDLLPDGLVREVAVYTVTRKGHEEMRRLIERGLSAAPIDPGWLRAAVSLAPIAERATVVELLHRRIVDLVRRISLVERRSEALRDEPGTPAHVWWTSEYELALLRAEADWCERFAQAVERGEMFFAGDPAGSIVDPSGFRDEDRRMLAEREAYVRMLADQRGWAPANADLFKFE